MIRRIKFLVFLLILNLSNTFVFGQTEWRNREDSLWSKFRLESDSSSSSEENYTEFLKESGSLGPGLQVWFEKKEKISNSFLKRLKIDRKKALTLFIPRDYKFLSYGEEHLKFYLLNFSNKTLFIPRMDATLDSISECKSSA